MVLQCSALRAREQGTCVANTNEAAGLEMIMSVFEFKVKVDHKSRSTADWQPEK